MLLWDSFEEGSPDSHQDYDSVRSSARWWQQLLTKVMQPGHGRTSRHSIADSCNVEGIQSNHVAICFVWLWLDMMLPACMAINNSPFSLPCLAKLQVDIICRHQLEHQSHERDEAEGLRMLRDAIRSFPFRAFWIPIGLYRTSTSTSQYRSIVDDNMMIT